MNKYSIGKVVMILILVLSLRAGLARAQETEPQAQSPANIQELAGTAFTYQGQLTLDGSPVNGACDMTFSLYDSLEGTGQIGTVLTKLVTVSDGRFTVQLDFGAGAFNGQGRWLRIA